MPNNKSKYKEWEDEIDISGEKIKKWMYEINEYLIQCNIAIKKSNLVILDCQHHLDMQSKRNIRKIYNADK